MNYYGTFEHTIDTKKRLTLPSKFCTKLSKVIIVNKGIDNCLELRTEEA
jgi:MraZ protein